MHETCRAYIYSVFMQRLIAFIRITMYVLSEKFLKRKHRLLVYDER